MDSKKVIIIGGIGNGSVIAAAVNDANLRGYNDGIIAGYLNDRAEVGSSIEGFPVLGKLEDADGFIEKGYYFINTLYRIDGQERRIELFENLRIPEERLFTFIHPHSYSAAEVKLGAGCVVTPGVCISPGVKMGICCLVMANATIGHNNVIGDHCHFAAQCCLGSYLQIGRGVHIGLNATVRENLKLDDYSALGMGAVLLNNMGQCEIWAGNPAKFIRKEVKKPERKRFTTKARRHEEKQTLEKALGFGKNKAKQSKAKQSKTKQNKQTLFTGMKGIKGIKP